MLKCQFCTFTSKILKNLRSHEKLEHFYTSEKRSKKSENVKNLTNPSLKNNDDDKNVENKIDIRYKENFKHFSCKFCPYSSNQNFNVKRHIKQNHVRKTDEYGICQFSDEAHSKKKNETYDMNEDKYAEKLLYRMNSAFERKNELGKEAMEMIRKYGICQFSDEAHSKKKNETYDMKDDKYLLKNYYIE